MLATPSLPNCPDLIFCASDVPAICCVFPGPPLRCAQDIAGQSLADGAALMLPTRLAMPKKAILQMLAPS